MKKVIIAVPYLSGKGGTETVINNFGEALKQNSQSEFQWLLVNFGGSKYPTWMKNWNRKVFNFSNNRLIQNLCYITIMPFLLMYLILSEKPDFIVSTNPVIWKFSKIFSSCLSSKTKVIAWYHYSFKKKNVNQFFLKNIDGFWAISTGIKEELISLGVPKDKIHIIFNPINTEDKHEEIKRSGNQNKFIYVGRIDYDRQKNVSELIKALSLVNGDWSCDLYGSIDTETKNRLENLIQKCKITNPIEFHGFSENVWEQIKEADALIMTSKYEGFPMVLCEAASRGIPLIAANCPTGVSDIVSDENGFLYQPGDFELLGEIINNIISKRKLFPSEKAIKESMQRYGYQEYIARVSRNLCN